MATLPTTPTAATVGSKVLASNWNSQVQLSEEFFRVNRPIAALKQTSTQSLTTATFTGITFDTELLDRDGQHSTSVNTDRVIIGTTLGWYKVTGTVAFAGNATGTRRAAIYLNGAVSNGYAIVTPNATFTSVTVMALVQATVSTDYVQLMGWQDSGVALSTAASSGFQSYLTVEWIGS